MNTEDLQAVRGVIQDVTGVASEADSDIYDAGVTSVQALPLLLELETKFSVAIPDDRFIQSRTPRALFDMIQQLKQENG